MELPVEAVAKLMVEQQTNTSLSTLDRDQLLPPQIHQLIEHNLCLALPEIENCTTIAEGILTKGLTVYLER